MPHSSTRSADVDGYEFVRRLRADAATANVPVIFWSAVFGQHGSDRDLAESCGIAGILAKPCEPETILNTIDQVLDRLPAMASAPIYDEFDRDHAQLLTNKILAKVGELETANASLIASEQQYRELFKGNPFPMWIVDGETHRFLAVNDAAVRHYGYSAQEFLAMSAGDLVVGEAAPKFRRTDNSGTDCLSAPSGTLVHWLSSGKAIEVDVFCQAVLFEGRRARLELIEDTTERNRADRKIRQSEEQLHHLAERLRSAQEEERTRIARHLHDEMGQRLTALKMTSDWVLRRLPARGASQAETDIRHKLDAFSKQIDEMIEIVQKLASDLRPDILDLGIGAAIEWLTQEFQSRSEIDCTVVTPASDEPLDSQRATEMYRIFQEALTNVARHSGATRLDVDLKQERSRLVLTVHDNGRGITDEQAADSNAIGLLGMRERAALIGANLLVRGRAGDGTTVRVELPLSRATNA